MRSGVGGCTHKKRVNLLLYYKLNETVMILLFATLFAAVTTSMEYVGQVQEHSLHIISYIS